jgi:hypothetical protein
MAENSADLQSGDGRRKKPDLQQKLGVTVGFKDHFSARSDDYARYRPTYPDKLFQYLASVVEERSVAWDCATGSGQAFHWFYEAMFLSEAQRVLKPSGVLAIWCYELCLVAKKCDAIIDTLYRDIVGEFWPPERVTIEQGYASVQLPGEAIAAPTFEMSLSWRVEDMLGYLRTWSACKRYESEKGSDPVALIAVPLAEAWGKEERRVSWPLQIKVCRANTLLE